jgi:hypothetical protein
MDSATQTLTINAPKDSLNCYGGVGSASKTHALTLVVYAIDTTGKEYSGTFVNFDVTLASPCSDVDKVKVTAPATLDNYEYKMDSGSKEFGPHQAFTLVGSYLTDNSLCGAISYVVTDTTVSTAPTIVPTTGI